MPEPLHFKRFTAEMQGEVADFSCNPDPSKMAEWITGNGCVASMARGTEVWLVRNSANDLIGFVSLGLANWSIRQEGGPKEPVSIIPAMGLQTSFHGHPTGVPKNEKYSRRLLNFLVKRALVVHSTDFIVLYVHMTNEKAIGLYRSAGFEFLPGYSKGNRTMAKALIRDSKANENQ
jgi:GNAT superfamily N-acetyltransferase